MPCRLILQPPVDLDIVMLQDHQDGESFQVVAPYYGWFHPKDAPELVERFGVDKKPFQFYDRALARWLTLSPQSGTRWVSGLDELHYRSLDVRDAPGMPGMRIARGTKRDADGTPVSDWSGPSSSAGCVHLIDGYSISRLSVPCGYLETPCRQRHTLRSGTSPLRQHFLLRRQAPPILISHAPRHLRAPP